MKMDFYELPVGSCFTSGRSKGIKKKVGDDRIATVSKKGRVRTRAVKGNPKVQSSGCPIKYIGVGMRKHPDVVVEIGDGYPRRVIDRRIEG